MTRTVTHILGAFALALATPVFAGEQPTDYASPQDALEAFGAALKAGDGALLDVFGTGSEDLLSTGSPDHDADNRQQVLEMYSEGYRFQPGDDGHVVLLLGSDGWPFPIPLAKGDKGWHFDIAAGRDEVLFRRIGLNELDTIEIMRAYVDVQSEYRLTDHDGDGVMEFAASLLSSDNADGLYTGDADSPLGIRIAQASLDGYNDGTEDREAEPYGGYYYRILTSQTASAPGGAMDYIVNGNMVGGHALLAVPSAYGDTGVHSFLVGENGIVLQADLGEDSLDRANGMRTFDPGDGWTRVED